MADLPPELRASLQRNTGVLIELVFEDSPAFYADVLPGDVLIQVDGVDVRNMEHAASVLESAAPPKGERFHEA